EKSSDLRLNSRKRGCTPYSGTPREKKGATPFSPTPFSSKPSSQLEVDMRAKIAVAVVNAALLSTLTVRVFAHHGFAAEFDATSPITLKGVITKIERLNPHGWIYVDVKSQ